MCGGGCVIVSFGVSDTGSVRTENEDRILVEDQMGLFIVADGMGGHTHGELAAELAVTTVRIYVDHSRDRADVTWPFGYDFNLSMNENRLQTAIQLANRQVWRRSEESPECAGMGTTVVAALVKEDHAAIASVGDSRVYLFRQGTLQQLTADDTWVAAMVRQGTLDPAQVWQHPMRNVLTQAAGAREIIDVHTREQALEPGDIVLLSSDGLHSVVDEADILRLLNGGGNLKQCADRLLEAVRGNEAPDNVSCILLRYLTGGDSQE